MHALSRSQKKEAVVCLLARGQTACLLSKYRVTPNQGKLISLYQVVPSGQKSEAANLELNKPNMGAEFLEFANKPNMGAHSHKI